MITNLMNISIGTFSVLSVSLIPTSTVLIQANPTPVDPTIYQMIMGPYGVAALLLFGMGILGKFITSQIKKKEDSDGALNKVLQSQIEDLKKDKEAALEEIKQLNMDLREALAKIPATVPS